MLNKPADFFECPLVDQEVDTLAGGEFPFFVLIFNSLFAAAHQRGRFSFTEIFEFVRWHECLIFRLVI